jgi:hypothetical protein
MDDGEASSLDQARQLRSRPRIYLSPRAKQALAFDRQHVIAVQSADHHVVDVEDWGGTTAARLHARDRTMQDL